MMKRAVETEETKSTAFEGALREREGEVGSSDVDCILGNGVREHFRSNNQPWGPDYSALFRTDLTSNILFSQLTLDINGDGERFQVTDMTGVARLI